MEVSLSQARITAAPSLRATAPALRANATAGTAAPSLRTAAPSLRAAAPSLRAAAPALRANATAANATTTAKTNTVPAASAAAQAVANARPHRHIIDRLVETDRALVRLDITGAMLKTMTKWEREEFFAAMQANSSVTHVHLSGDDLQAHLTPEEIVLLVDSIGYINNLSEFFVFKGSSDALTGERLAACLNVAINLKVLMLWGFTLYEEPILAAAIRSHLNLNRVTLTISKKLPYAALDVYAMGLAMMRKLKCLSIRCNCRQVEPVFSPEAMAILMGNRTIESMYLENIGLTDDHSDAIALELPMNRTLTLLDLKHNLFTDDALFAFAIAFKQNFTLKSLDLSGVSISARGVYALTEALQVNSYVQNIELEGQIQRYMDEFNVPEGHGQTDYMQSLHLALKLNRAGPITCKEGFVEGLILVSEHVGTLFPLIKRHAKYFQGVAEINRMKLQTIAL